MAYGPNPLSQDYRDWAAADKVLLAGRNWLRGNLAKWNTAGTWAAADQSLSTAPASYGFDDADHLKTESASAGTTQHYMINLQSAIGEVDSVFILNHNFNGYTVSVDFDANQNGNFTAVHTAQSIAVTSAKRIAFLDLDHAATGNAQRYSEVQYMRIRIVGASFLPELGEVIVSRRRQMQYNPIRPWADKDYRSNVNRFVSETGVVKNYTLMEGRRHINADFILCDQDRVDDACDFFVEDIGSGTEPFMWVDQPDASPSDAYWMRFDDPPRLNLPTMGPVSREWSFGPATEQGPNYLKSGGV